MHIARRPEHHNLLSRTSGLMFGLGALIVRLWTLICTLLAKNSRLKICMGKVVRLAHVYSHYKCNTVFHTRTMIISIDQRIVLKMLESTQNPCCSHLEAW